MQIFEAFTIGLTCKRNLFIETVEITIDPDILKDRIGFTDPSGKVDVRGAKSWTTVLGELKTTSGPLSNTWSVFPNPFSAEIHIVTKMEFKEPTHYFLYNALGQKVMAEEMDGSDMLLETGGLVNGLYFLIVENKDYLEMHSMIHH